VTDQTVGIGIPEHPLPDGFDLGTSDHSNKVVQPIAAELTIELPEPLGDRTLVDLGHYPPREAELIPTFPFLPPATTAG